ncbi:MAG TPA: RNA 2',3'-cyclic phosphodiesterase [Terriglobia bacterium]|nr:RNA 2',3'-cyclic phosphodiesterase [Terriglobia bacterium]
MAWSKKRQGFGEKDQVRSFICIEIPPSIQSRIEELQRRLRPSGADVSWVKASNIHLTLKFLGDVSQSQLAAVRSGLLIACKGQAPVDLKIGGTGAFPSLRNPRVLWVGVAGISETLTTLHKAIEEMLEKEGFPRENKPFSPHLTFGRIRSPHKVDSLADALAREEFVAESIQTERVILMRSQLSPGGSVYTPIAVVPLTGMD